MSRQFNPEQPRCCWCDRRLSSRDLHVHEDWHSKKARGLIAADMPDPIPGGGGWVRGQDSGRRGNSPGAEGDVDRRGPAGAGGKDG
jgi:hypothetical protein